LPSRSARTGARIVNLLKVRAPQQVMLEVRVAEVSKSYLESLGVEWGRTEGINNGSLMTGFVNNATLSLILGRGVAQKVNADGTPLFSNTTDTLRVEAQRKDGWVKILAEPTIVAMSGQEGRFLVGGKIFIPVNQALGSTTYEERTYGVGLRFVPTVLESGRINLRVAPEISEPVKESVTAGTAASLPAFKSSLVSTTVQMAEGENLVIGGLLRDNINEIIKAVPLLGELPVLGALFRSSQYITERTELLIVVRPTLVKAMRDAPKLPTDTFTPPTRSEFFMGGQLQGTPKPDRGAHRCAALPCPRSPRRPACGCGRSCAVWACCRPVLHPIRSARPIRRLASPCAAPSRPRNCLPARRKDPPACLTRKSRQLSIASKRPNRSNRRKTAAARAVSG
jgi:pilus assembly protein CpaC